MIPREVPRRFGTLLLRFAIWIAPHSAHDWGRGMLGELNHVEGNWAALIWAIGGAGVLVKQAMLAVILPGSHRPTVTSASELFDKEGPMRKTTLAVIASCVLASLLCFFVPVFRQAFQVSVSQWDDVFHVERSLGSEAPDPELDALAKKAEENHDAEALGFVAVREPNQSEAVRLADKAVRLDPSLTWLYAIVAVHWSSFQELDRWVPALERFDPQNALPYLIAAERIDIDQVVREQIPHRTEEESAAWKNAMSAAFQSHKLDDYLDRVKRLDRRVLVRHGISDPFQVVNDRWYRLPSYGISDSSRYAEWLIGSGDALAVRGDPRGAAEKYLVVASFGQLLTPTDSFFLGREIKEAYMRLGALSEMDGNKAEAAFYASLRDQLDRESEKEHVSWRSRFRGSKVSHWDAFLVRLAGFLMLFCGSILLICAVAVMLRSRSVRLASLQPSRLTLTLGFGAALGSLLASAVLFVSYWPYSRVLDRFISSGEESGVSELSSFLGDARLPLGSQFNLGSWYVGVSNYVFYFWFAVTILCVLALPIAVVRHFETRRRPRAA
jgi:hypothetical protein